MGEIELLKDFFYRDDRRLEMALVELESSFETIVSCALAHFIEAKMISNLDLSSIVFRLSKRN